MKQKSRKFRVGDRVKVRKGSLCGCDICNEIKNKELKIIGGTSLYFNVQTTNGYLASFGKEELEFMSFKQRLRKIKKIYGTK